MTEEKNTIQIQPIVKGVLKVKIGAIEGSTLITHRLTDEAVDEFMGREIGKSGKKKLRNYDNEYESCFYIRQIKNMVSHQVDLWEQCSMPVFP